MGNCLVTKLNAVVNNDNLDELGTVKFYGVVGTGSNKLWQTDLTSGEAELVITDENATISSAAGNCTKIDSKNGTIRPKRQTDSYNGFSIIATDTITTGYARFSAKIKNMYNITSLTFCDTDTYSIKKMKNLNYIRSYRRFKGKLSDLSELVSLVTIYIANSGSSVSENSIKGTMKDFGVFTRLKYLKLELTNNITGSLESFVMAQKRNGRTDTSENKMKLLFYNLTFITFNGAPVPNNNSTDFSVGFDFYWQPNNDNANYTDITFNGTTITVDENGNKVV